MAIWSFEKLYRNYQYFIYLVLYYTVSIWCFLKRPPQFVLTVTSEIDVSCIFQILPVNVPRSENQVQKFSIHVVAKVHCIGSDCEHKYITWKGIETGVDFDDLLLKMPTQTSIFKDRNI